VIDDATKEVVYRDYIDISVAVATPRVCWDRRVGISWKRSFP
jgi:pyruvate/2-oxoglutarate dehydrogenase complex dihydrolipoamide acyltransferase (E2) component